MSICRVFSFCFWKRVFAMTSVKYFTYTTNLSQCSVYLLLFSSFSGEIKILLKGIFYARITFSNVNIYILAITKTWSYFLSLFHFNTWTLNIHWCFSILELCNLKIHRTSIFFSSKLDPVVGPSWKNRLSFSLFCTHTHPHTLCISTR